MDTHKEQIRLLLDAAWAGDVDAFTEVLITNLEVIDGEGGVYAGWTALMRASFHGHTAIVQVLLAHGAQVDIQNYYGDTALMFAVLNSTFGAIQVLMEHKALLLSDDATLAEYSTKYSEYPPVLILVPPILILVKQEQNWRRRKPWLLFWLALRRSVVVAPSGTLTLQEKVLSFDFVGRKVASYL